MTELGVVFPAADNRGGVERVTLQVVTRLARTHDVAFIGNRFEPDAPSRVAFRQVPAEGRGPRAFKAAASRVLALDRPEVTLSFGVNCPPGDVYWVQSVHRAWLRSGSAVRIKGVNVPSAARRLLGRHRVLLDLERQYFTAHTPRAILCTSQREVDDLVDLYGVNRDLMHVVPNGYDAATFSPEARVMHRVEQRDAMGLTNDDVSLLFVANELHRKGFEALLQAVAITGNSRLKIDVVGRAAPTAYENRIRQLGLAERVRWHGPTKNVERFYAAGDLLVLPTQYEPFGLVIIEALACGLPVITTALAGAAPAVVRAVGRLQRDPNNANELAGLLDEALSGSQIQKWSRAAPAAVSDYEWDAVLRRAEPLILA